MPRPVSQRTSPPYLITALVWADPFGERPDLEAVVGTEQHGPDFDGDLLVIRRTVTWAGDGLGEVETEKIAPPTQAEITAVNAALDYLGYTGPREIRLLLAVDYA
jgi:hypothetical protein